MSEDLLSNISSEMLFSMIRKEAELEAACKKANAARTAHHRTVKALTGCDVQNFIRVYKLHTAADGGDKFLQDLREIKRMAEVAKVPVGHQFSILDELAAKREAKKAGTDDTHYFKQGVRVALIGGEESDCPHDPNTEAFQEWVEGFRFALDNAKKGDKAIENFNDEDKSAKPKKAKKTAAKKKTASKKSTVKNPVKAKRDARKAEEQSDPETVH